MSYCQHKLMFLYCCYAQTFLLKIQLLVKKVKQLLTVTLLYDNHLAPCLKLSFYKNFSFSLKYSSPVRAKQTHFTSLYLHFQWYLCSTHRLSMYSLIETYVKFNAFLCQCTTFTYIQVNCVCSSVVLLFISFHNIKV